MTAVFSTFEPPSRLDAICRLCRCTWSTDTTPVDLLERLVVHISAGNCRRGLTFVNVETYTPDHSELTKLGEEIARNLGNALAPSDEDSRRAGSSYSLPSVWSCAWPVCLR